MNNNTININLPEILASMDAVDVARNQEDILNEAINIDERKALLAAKLRATYDSQSIKVSDEIINKGVNDYFSDSHSFKPLKGGLNRLLAFSYISRAKIAKNFTICFGVIVLLVVGISGIGEFVKANKEKEIATQLANEKAVVLKVAQEKERVIAEEKAKIDELENLPSQIQSLELAIKSVSKDAITTSRAASIAATSLGYAKSSDLPNARASYAELTEIIALLNLEYDIRVNLSGINRDAAITSEGQKWVTGGWRSFKGNPNDKRFYVVVNCVNPNNGERINIPVRSGEDGSIRVVSSWAEQVPESVFNTIRGEKQRTGTIADTLMGRKSKGYIYPVYNRGEKVGIEPTQDTTNLRITRW